MFVFFYFELYLHLSLSEFNVAFADFDINLFYGFQIQVTSIKFEPYLRFCFPHSTMTLAVLTITVFSTFLLFKLNSPKLYLTPNLLPELNGRWSWPTHLLLFSSYFHQNTHFCLYFQIKHWHWLTLALTFLLIFNIQQWIWQIFLFWLAESFFYTGYNVIFTLQY